MDPQHYDAYLKAKKRVKKKKGYYAHLISYVSVMIFFMAINLATYSEEPVIWFFWPMLGWGVGLLIHTFSVFGIPGVGPLDQSWEQKQIKKEMEKMGSPASYEDEVPEEEELELKDPDEIIIKRTSPPTYRDSDFV